MLLYGLEILKISWCENKKVTREEFFWRIHTQCSYRGVENAGGGRPQGVKGKGSLANEKGLHQNESIYFSLTEQSQGICTKKHLDA